MSLKQYSAFLKTVECRSVSGAAAALGVSQSALTQLLGALEKEFGFRLLVRNKGGVRLTPEGKRVYAAVQQVAEADARLHRLVERCARAAAAPSRLPRSRASRSTGCRP